MFRYVTYSKQWNQTVVFCVFYFDLQSFIHVVTSIILLHISKVLQSPTMPQSTVYVVAISQRCNRKINRLLSLGSPRFHHPNSLFSFHIIADAISCIIKMPMCIFCLRFHFNFNFSASTCKLFQPLNFVYFLNFSVAALALCELCEWWTRTSFGIFHVT